MMYFNYVYYVAMHMWAQVPEEAGGIESPS